MTIKTFKSKTPMIFNWEDAQGKTHEFKLAGEMPIEAVLKLAELENQGKDKEITKDDLVEIYAAVLGDEQANKLIFELKVGQETLEEVLTWYGEELAARKKIQTNPKETVAKVQRKR